MWVLLVSKLRTLFIGKSGEGKLAGYLLLSAVSVAIVFGLLPRDLIVNLAKQDNATLVAAYFRGHYAGATPVTLIDIDDHTYRAWGEPATTPHDKLLQLIEKVLKLDPVAIVVDIDLSSPDRSQRTALLDRLGGVARDAVGKDHAPPLLLVRKLRSDPARGKGRAVFLSSAESEIDSLVAAAPNMAWVSAFMFPSSRGVVEEWAAFSPVCTDSPPRGLPSVALATYVAQKAPGQLKALDVDLAAASRLQCLGSSLDQNAARKIPVANIPTDLSPIPYIFGWPLESTSVLPTTDTAHGPRPLVMKISAVETEGAEVAPDIAIGRVVVIGASHADSKDFHQTPLGVMPGAYVLANMVAGANDIFGSTLAPRSRAALFAVAFFAATALVATLLRSLLVSISILVLGVIFLFGGLHIGLSASTIQEGLLLGFATFAVYALLLQAYSLLQGRVVGKRKPLKEFILSDYALKGLRKER